MNNFNVSTYNISSSEAVSTDATYAQWTIRLEGLDPKYRKFHCKVIDFVINSNSLNAAMEGYTSLCCENLGDNIISKHGFKHLCFVNTDVSVCQLFSGVGSEFNCDNFNTKEITFFLVDPDNTKVLISDINVTVTTYWNLSMLITPIE